jgi:acyl transferase domain-containing protein
MGCEGSERFTRRTATVTISAPDASIALTSLVRKDTRARDVVAVASAPAPGASEEAAFLSALGRVWSAGVDVELAPLDDGEARRRVSLPG